MNKLNVASFKASQKLHEAGIVLETECYWHFNDYKYEWQIERRDYFTENIGLIPAPSMAELLREMPIETSVEKTDDGYIVPAWKWNRYYCNENPADALIELLIWLKEQNRERIVKKLIDHADKLKW